MARQEKVMARDDKGKKLKEDSLILSTSINNHRAQDERLRDQIKNKEGKIALLDIALGNKNDELHSVENLIIKQKEILAKATKEAQEHELQAKYLSDRNAKIAQEGTKEHEVQVNSHSEAITVLRADLSDKTRQRDGILGDIKTKTAEKSTLEAEIKPLTGQRDGLVKSIEELNQTKISLGKEVMALEKNRNELKIDPKTIKEFKEKVDAVKKELSGEIKKKEEITKSRDIIEKEISDRMQTIEKKEAEQKRTEERQNTRDEFLKGEAKRLDTLAKTLQKHFDKHDIPINVI